MNFNTPKALLFCLIISIPAGYKASDSIPVNSDSDTLTWKQNLSHPNSLESEDRRILLEDNIFKINTVNVSNLSEIQNELTHVSFDVETTESVSYYVVEGSCKEGNWVPLLAFKSEETKEMHLGSFRNDQNYKSLRLVAYQQK
jgi:hypothetical protein